jgi:hypothetical protein
MKLILILIISIISITLTQNNNNPQCRCPRNIKKVCGSDGVTYLNKCLAECQNARVLFFGDCSEGSGSGSQNVL